MQEEISKHTKKAYKTIKSEQSFSEKLKEIAIEIGIIVFAVTLSIWLHSWSEHRHQQAEVKEFMADLKEDLQADLIEVEEINQKQSENQRQILITANLTKIQLDSLKKINGRVNFNANLLTTKFRVGNYEGFKSSGKIGFIENKKLKKLILDYYQQTVPNITDLEKLNYEQVLKIIDYIADRANEPNEQLFLDAKYKLKFRFLSETSAGNIQAYKQIIKDLKILIAEINKTK